MPENKVYLPSEIGFSFSEIPARTEPQEVLTVDPGYFDIVDVKNVHMQNQQGKVDKTLARHQWQVLGRIYSSLQHEGILKHIHILTGQKGCEDMVFAANQSFPWLMPDGEKVVVMSKMKHLSRQREIPFFERFYRKKGYKILYLQQSELFEGMGDAIPLPGKRLLFGGYGFRTDLRTYDELAGLLQTPIVVLKLINEKFYHLDTCFLPLGNKVMLFPGAFRAEDLKKLEKLFSEIIPIPEKEAEENFALNAHVIFATEKVAILQQGSPITRNILQNEGFSVFEVETGEFIKSGGSVFCMKMMIY